MNQEFKPGMVHKAKTFIRECRRVLYVTKKPTTDEYKTTVKVAGLGMILIGLMGFLLQMVKQLLFRGFT